MLDAAYQAKYLQIARMLWDTAEGDPERIPDHYASHLGHSYSDGDISMVSLLNRFDCAVSMEEQELDEAIELLGKVRPQDWPDVEDIESVSLTDLLSIEDDDEDSFNFAEDNLGTAQTVEKGLAKVIESVLGEPVDNVRGKGGDYPSADNNFLQDDDGTFSGTFKHGEHKFNFEIFPDESGWTVTYRMSPETIDNLPPLHDQDKEEDDPTKKDYSRRTRNKGWR